MTQHLLALAGTVSRTGGAPDNTSSELTPNSQAGRFDSRQASKAKASNGCTAHLACRC